MVKLNPQAVPHFERAGPTNFGHEQKTGPAPKEKTQLGKLG